MRSPCAVRARSWWHMTRDEERFEERAAIREFDGMFPRAEAERLAREEMGR